MTTDMPWSKWRHITKLDPEKDLHDGDTLADVVATGTDAIVIGGTTGMTQENVSDVLTACLAHNIPVYQEPAHPGCVIDDSGLAGYLIPTVLNASTPFWVVGAHKEWARATGGLPANSSMEAYIVLNPKSDVATYTESNCDLTTEDVVAYAQVAEELFGQNIIYLEYSGTLGEPSLVDVVRGAVDDATVFYGGGIHSYEDAKTMAAVSDVVVVGNLLYEEGVEALEETVRGVSDATTATNRRIKTE